jgi:hypothetical protein
LSITRLIHVPVFLGLLALDGVVIAAVIDNQSLAQKGGGNNVVNFTAQRALLSRVFSLMQGPSCLESLQMCAQVFYERSLCLVLSGDAVAIK